MDVQQAARAQPRGELVIVDRLRRVWTTWPHACFYTVLAFGTAIALADQPVPVAGGGWLAGSVGVTAIWMHFWVGELRTLDGDRQPVNLVRRALLGVLGAASAATLVYQNVSFTIVAVPTVASLFLALPITLAAPCVVAIGIALDAATRRSGLEPHSDGVLLATLVVRIVGVIGLGVVIKAITTQSEERRVLLETLATAERRAGVLEERGRLAREIHDTVAQGFAGIVVHLEAADLAVHRSADELRANLRFALDVARDGLVESRRMMAALRPELLEDHALAAAIERVCGDWSQRAAIAARVEVTGEVRALDRDIEVTLLRATQEALSNVRKHARAQSVTVTLTYMDSVVAVDVCDDGSGFASGAAEGFGLRGMRERVERLGGGVVVESDARQGTTLNVSLPCAPIGDALVPDADVAPARA